MISNQPILVKHEGLTANQHRLPAYDAGESIAGFSRALELTTYFLATEKVRHRKPDLHSFHLELVATKPGSFEFLFNLASNTDLFIGIGAGLSTNIIYDFFKYMMNKITDQELKTSNPTILKLENDKSPDLEALADAIEYSGKRFHTPINKGASQIFIINGDNNTINLNSKTKEFINGNKKDLNTRAKVFSIGAFNVNSGYGRAFDKEEGRTIPFQVTKDAEHDTKAIIAASLRRYAISDEAWIELKYDRILSPNGKVKKLLVRDANEITV